MTPKTAGTGRRKLSVDELTRLAFIYAEQDRASFLDAWSGVNDPEGKRVQSETKTILKQLHDYRIKRWGKTKLEAVVDGCKTISALEMYQDAP